MSEEPWFRMRPSKFMAGCRGLNSNEVKVYISLICRIMEHGAPVEEDHEILATYCEMRPTSFATALDRLVRLKKLIRTEDGRLTNSYCDGEISWRASYSENQKRAGKKSAEKRKENQSGPATSDDPSFNQKKEIREEEIREEKTPPTPQGGLGEVDCASSEFDRIWPHYPRRVGVAPARRAWVKARTRATYDQIAAPLRACIRAWASTPPDKIPHFATWLNRDGWLDDPGHAANRPRTAAEDIASLSRITAAQDAANLFADIPHLRIAK